ncbi:MAG: virginiamycin B lyase family protein, partial [Acidimicrobiia bacterium]
MATKLTRRQFLGRAGAIGAAAGFAPFLARPVARAAVEAGTGPPVLPAGDFHMTVGSDGNLWVAEYVANTIRQLAPTGEVSAFAVPSPASAPSDLTAGPDGSVWFTEENGNRIGRITVSGEITEFPVPTPASEPAFIAAGPDGNLWFAETAANRIGRITTAGSFAE